MIRYRTGLFAAALAAGLAFGGTWYAAGVAPGVHPTPDRLAVPLDDAAIYFQYARQALHGEWLRYNPGAPLSTGVTSPLYFLLLTAGMGLGLSGPVCAWLLGLSGLLLGLVSADRLARRLFGELPHWWAGLLLLSQGAWVAAHFNAMETGLQLGLTWALLESLGADPREESPEWKPWLVLAALALSRPEGQVLVALLGCAWAAPHARRLGLVLLIAAAPTLLLLLVSGSIVPDSVRPKAAALFGSIGLLDHAAQASSYAMGVIKGAWMGFWGGADAVGTVGDAASQNPIGPQFPPLALLGALFGFFSLAQGAKARRPLALAVGAGMLALLGLLAWNLPVGWHDHRYLACATPLLLFGMLAGLDALRREGRAGVALAGALFTLWTVFGLASWPWHLKRSYDGAFNYAIANTNAALALRNMPPGPVAVVDSGLLAYYSGREIVDLPGITDHAMALAYPQGPGATLKAILREPHLPEIAALHDRRDDFKLGPWLKSGLLVRLSDLSSGMGLYRWDWSNIKLRAAPAALPVGHKVLGYLDVADTADEAAQGVAYWGALSGRTLLARQRLWRGGPVVPEGGRQVAGLSLRAWPAGTRLLLLRAEFAGNGYMEVLGQGTEPGRTVANLPSDSETYSELLLPLVDAKGSKETLTYFSGGPGQSPVPADFALYRVWFLN
jgi:hypothetical protein